MLGGLHQLPPGAASGERGILVACTTMEIPMSSLVSTSPNTTPTPMNHPSLPHGYYLEKRQSCDPMSYTGDIQSLTTFKHSQLEKQLLLNIIHLDWGMGPSPHQSRRPPHGFML